MMNLFRRRKIFELNPDNPSYKVSYLGNVATAAARPSKQPASNGRVDEIVRSLNRLWAAHLMRPTRIAMQLTVCNDGLKVSTEQYGLVEYWAHRITFCGVHPDFPSVFVWIYRHDGKNMKPDLRFHGALCTKPEKAELIAQQLQHKIRQALLEFKREKLSKQRSRLRHESLMQKFGELADLFVHKDANILQRPMCASNFACNDDEDDDVFPKPVGVAGKSFTGSSKPVTIKSNSTRARTFVHDCSETGGNIRDGSCGACSVSISSESWSSSSSNRDQQHSPNQFEYNSSSSSCIQPKRKDLKSCSKNYRPHTSQIGAPKLHSIDEESEFMEDEPRFRKLSKALTSESLNATLKPDKISSSSRAYSLPPSPLKVNCVAEKLPTAEKRDTSMQNEPVLLPTNDDAVVEEADLSDDGVFCCKTSSSTADSTHFTSSSSSGASSTSTRTSSHSITDEEEDQDSNSSVSVHSYDVDLAMPYGIMQPFGPNNSAPPLSKQTFCCDTSTVAETSDISENQHADNFDDNMQHLRAMLLEKRLGHLALADLENAD